MRSEEENLSIVDDYLAKEVRLGRVMGPLEAQTVAHISQQVWSNPKEPSVGKMATDS